MGKWPGTLGWIALPFAAAVFGAQASAADYYATLVKPSWAPPPNVFGPVWGVLYLAMGVSAAMVWRRCGFAGARVALLLFLIQLAANALWSPLFFRWQQPGWAAVDIVVLLGLIVATTTAFWRVHRAAAALLLPYLAWAAFATALNLSIWKLNPGLTG